MSDIVHLEKEYDQNMKTIRKDKRSKIYGEYYEV